MPDDPPTNISASDLPAALYLNQRLVFDMLASLEGGFSTLTSIEAATTSSSGTEKSGKGSIGINNVFALLGVTFGGAVSKSSSDAEQRSISEEKVHTPTSLFARLRLHLDSSGLLKRPDDVEFSGISSGDFVEFKVKLQRSPLVQSLQGLQQIVSLASAFQEPTNRTRGQQRQQGNQSPDSAQVKNQVSALLNAVKSSDSEDLIGTDRNGLRYVLTTEIGHFVDPSLNDVIDGEFFILGKVTRVVEEDSETGIDLLRKTSLGMFSESVLGNLFSAFEGMVEAGFKIPTIETSVKGPALQVIPIAIFA